MRLANDSSDCIERKARTRNTDSNRKRDTKNECGGEVVLQEVDADAQEAERGEERRWTPESRSFKAQPITRPTRNSHFDASARGLSGVRSTLPSDNH